MPINLSRTDKLGDKEETLGYDIISLLVVQYKKGNGTASLEEQCHFLFLF